MVRGHVRDTESAAQFEADVQAGTAGRRRPLPPLGVRREPEEAGKSSHSGVMPSRF